MVAEELPLHSFMLKRAWLMADLGKPVMWLLLLKVICEDIWGDG